MEFLHKRSTYVNKSKNGFQNQFKFTHFNFRINIFIYIY